MSLRLSLKRKLQIIFGALSAIVLILFGVLAQRSEQALIQAKSNQVEEASDSILDKIDRNLFERYGDVQAYAMSEPARSMNQERIVSFMNDMMTTYAPIYDLMMVTDLSGRVIAVNSSGKDGKKVSSEFMLGADFSSENWFKTAVSGEIKPGMAYFEDLDFDKDVARAAGTDGRVMRFTSPIRDPRTGKILGVWTNRMSWSDVVVAIINEEKAKLISDRITAADIFLVDTNGRYLMHPEGDSFELKTSLRDFDKYKEKIGKTGFTQIIESEKQGSVIEVFAASKGYASYPGKGWTAVIDVPVMDTHLAFDRNLVMSAFIIIIIANLLTHLFVSRLSGSFERIMSQLSSEAHQLFDSSRAIHRSSQSLAGAATEQAAAIEETASSMEEMSSMLSQTSQQAALSLSVAEKGRKDANQGRVVIARMSGAMDEIEGANAKLDALVKLIGEIKDRTQVINEIVSETRLLSFNASIEAARAGVHGKGFAVVAEEVGKLAAMSGKAADEIRELLDSSTEEVAQVVKGTQERVAMGKRASEECESTFNSMGETLVSIAESVKVIATATREQETGVKQTNAAMNEMDQATQSNSRAAETLASHATALSTGAQSLHVSVESLKDIVLGGVQQVPMQHSPVPSFSHVNQSPQHFSATNGGSSAPSNAPATQSVEAGAPERKDSRWKSAS